MALLDGGLRGVFGAAFGGVYLPGTLTKASVASVDEFGDPVSGSPTTTPLRAQVDSFSDMVRAQAGIPEGVVRIIILQATSAAVPLPQDRITIGTEAYSVRGPVTADPANTHWIVQGSRIET